MNSIIEDFITNVFTPDFVSLIRQSFSLFEAFEHQNAYTNMINIIMSESFSDTESRAEQFSVELANQLDYVVKEHLIHLTDEATIRDRVDIIDALYRFQHLESYIPYSAILDTDLDSTDKLAKIIVELTNLEEGHVLSLIKEVDPRTLSLMETFIEDKEQHQIVDLTPPFIKERMKLFVEVSGKASIGFIILEGGMKMGYPVKLYLPFVNEHLVVENNPHNTAANILSIIYISDVEGKDVLTVYREISEGIFKSLDEVAKVESYMLNIIYKVEELRKINHEKLRLSQASPTEQPSK